MKTRQLLKRSFSFFKTSSPQIIACLVFSVVCAILPLVLPVLEGNMLGNIFLLSKTTTLAAWLFGVGVVLELSLFFSDFCVNILSNRVEKIIKLEVLSALSKIKIKSIAATGSGTFTTRLNQDSEKLATGYAEVFAGIAEIFSNTAFLVFLLIASLWLGLYTLLGMLLLFFTNWLRIYIWKKGNTKILAQTEKANSLTNEMIAGAKEVKSLGNIDYALKKADNELDKLRKVKYEENLKQSGLSHSSEILSLFLNFGFILLSVMLIKEGYLTVSTFFIVYIYRNHAKGFLNSLIGFKGKIEEIKFSATRIIEIVDGNRKFLHHEFGDVQIEKTKGKIEVKNLSFAFHYKKPILKNINVTIMPNEVVAIIGKSGSGKTTLLSVIAGEFSPSKGEVLIDNQNIKELSQKSQDRAISFSGADPFFFTGSIRDNLLRANPSASFLQIVDACKVAGIHDEISVRSSGYDTEIREQTLSSGEKKRLSLARAILKNSKILLLDEPTQNLDKDNQTKLIKAILSLSKSHTIVISTHDMKLAESCNSIYLLENGQLKKQQS